MHVFNKIMQINLPSFPCLDFFTLTSTSLSGQASTIVFIGADGVFHSHDTDVHAVCPNLFAASTLNKRPAMWLQVLPNLQSKNLHSLLQRRSYKVIILYL